MYSNALGVAVLAEPSDDGFCIVYWASQVILIPSTSPAPHHVIHGPFRTSFILQSTFAIPFGHPFINTVFLESNFFFADPIL